MTHLLRLRAKLSRELAQAEHDARTHPRREARRLGDTPPAEALRAIAAHAASQWPRYHALMVRNQTLGLGIGRAVGAMVAAIRHAFVDRMIDSEQSYRGTLLGLRRGVDTARLLREVADRTGDLALVRFCDDLLGERLALLERADLALAWFADEPQYAIASGLRLAIAPPRTR